LRRRLIISAPRWRRLWLLCHNGNDGKPEKLPLAADVLKKKVESDCRGPKREEAADAEEPSLDDSGCEFIGRRQNQRVGKIDLLVPERLENAAQSRGGVVGLKARRAEVAQNRIISRLIRMIERGDRRPDESQDRELVGNAHGGRLCLYLRRLDRLRPRSLCRRRPAGKREHGGERKSGRGEPRPDMIVAKLAYHAAWKPARAPTSPLLRPTPMPAEKDDIGPIRAEKAAVPAARFWK